MKILITILTSSKLDFLLECYESIIHQIQNKTIFEIVIIVNTLNEDYYQEVKTYFIDKIPVVRTLCNGKPGKGHNSTIDYFINHNQYDYLIKVDGDDFLYPPALSIIKNIILTHKPDIIILPFFDNLKNICPGPNLHMPLTKTYLSFNNTFDVFPYWIKNNKSPFTHNLRDINTPGKIFLISRKTINLDLNIKFDEDMEIIEDLYPYLNILSYYNEHPKKINCYYLNSHSVYLYNKINTNSSCFQFSNKGNEKWEQLNILFQKSILGKFDNIRNWPIDSIPIITTDVEINYSITDKIKWVKKLERKLMPDNSLNVHKLDLSFIPSFINYCKNIKNYELLEIYQKYL